VLPVAAIAAHLRSALLLNRPLAGRVRAVDLVVGGLLCAAVAAAGPAWQRLPNPFLAETAPLVVALQLSASMQATDVQPSRLERARQKILDLVALRAGARTGLVAYAGSAHLVLPLTEDPAIIKPFLEGLDPKIMPRPGNAAAAALSLAGTLLAAESTPGSILFVTDGVAATDIPAFAAHHAQTAAPGVLALVIGSSDGGLVRHADGRFAVDSEGRRVTARVDEAALSQWEREGGVTVVRAGVGDADLQRIERRVASHRQQALDVDADAAWDDRGRLLIWPAALLVLLWFRRGTTMQWLWPLVLLAGLAAPDPARAEGFIDLWLTPDQQGRYAYERKRFDAAAERFQDPMWRGIATYRAGHYEEAAEAFARINSAEAAFNMGNALVKARKYAEAIDAFRHALAERPDYPAARQNLVIAEAIFNRLNRIRAEEGTGKLGADEVVYDKAAGEGRDTVITGDSKLERTSAEQWMRAVDTRTRDFLRSKFALEAGRAAGE